MEKQPPMHRCLFFNARQIVQITRDPKAAVLTGPAMKELAVLTARENDGTGYSLVIDSKGLIADIGPDGEIESKFGDRKFERKIDCSNKTLIPGLVDAHTHPVFAGDRVGEFAMKLRGATYMDVHNAGGGIHFTVRATREASQEDLYTSFKERAEKMSTSGTTLLEAKSGYGLETEAELKMLRVLERAKQELPFLEISGTYCGAHAVPKGAYSTGQYVDDVLCEHLPALRKEMDEGRLTVVENCDVFCEKGIFSVAQTESILQRAKDELGLAMNFHAEELNQLNSAEMGARIGARAISHLEEVSSEGISAMAESGSVAVVLPTTAYILHLKSPPVREMIDAGVAVALGSDFNPNAHCYSMPLVMNLACLLFGMTMEEALVASTLNAAASLGRGGTHGSLQAGRVGDVLVLDAPRWEHLIYQMGDSQSLIKMVVKRGIVVRES